MSKVALAIGLLLIVVGVAGYITPSKVVVTEGDTDGKVVEAKRSFTALIPAAFGIPILICGIRGTTAPNSNKNAMHIAVTFGLVGALAATGQGIVFLLKFINGDEFNQRTFVFLILMGVLCWIFVIACVMSFINARKAQEALEAKGKPAG